ncbi:hypothetical protein SNEBB_010404 [Seison nebaliae]|nr:hypothetical protein SNEBB_010404 [Seison nebaliae]
MQSIHQLTDNVPNAFFHFKNYKAEDGNQITPPSQLIVGVTSKHGICLRNLSFCFVFGTYCKLQIKSTIELDNKLVIYSQFLTKKN